MVVARTHVSSGERCFDMLIMIYQHIHIGWFSNTMATPPATCNLNLHLTSSTTFQDPSIPCPMSIQCLIPHTLSAQYISCSHDAADYRPMIAWESTAGSAFACTQGSFATSDKSRRCDGSLISRRRMKSCKEAGRHQSCNNTNSA